MKTSRRCRSHQQKQKRPHIVFTPNELALLEQVLLPLEKRLRLTTEQYPNIAFALKTVRQVQAKIHKLTPRGIVGELVGFDENEILLMETALLMYITALPHLEPGKERDTLLLRCQMLSWKIAESKTLAKS